MAGKNLILSIIYGLNVSECKVFIESARKHVPNADIVFFYEHIGKRTIAYLEEYNVKLIPFSRRFPFGLTNAHERLKGMGKFINQRFEFPMLLRNVLFNDFLSKNEYDQVLTSDVSDVVFQADPFTTKATLQCFLECADRHLLSEENNGFWLKHTYPTDYKNFDGLRISCAGVVYGNNVGMLSYFNAFINELLDRISTATPQLYDQAIHNKIVHFTNIDGLTLVEDEEGVVCTQSHYKPFIDSQFNNGYCNKEGQLIPVLHQYNRVRKLARYFNTQYGNHYLVITKAYKKIRSVKNRIMRQFRQRK